MNARVFNRYYSDNEFLVLHTYLSLHWGQTPHKAVMQTAENVKDSKTSTYALFPSCHLWGGCGEHLSNYDQVSMP